MWLDNLLHNYIDGDGNVKVGLQLILLTPDNLKAREYCNITGGDCMNWKKAYGVLVTLKSDGIKSLEDYFKNKKSKKKVQDMNFSAKTNERLKIETLNEEWLVTCSTVMEAVKPFGFKYHVYPQVDLIDLSIIQKCLMGLQWKDIKYPGIPGIKVNNSIMVALDNEEAWINVWVSKHFNECTNGMYDSLLPCSAILNLG